MEAGTLLGHLRSGVVLLDRLGTIVQVEGGLGGILGHAPSDLVGRNALELIAPEDLGTMAEVFASGDDALPILRFPAAFSVSLVRSDGTYGTVDIVPTGVDDDDLVGWVLTVTPRESQPAQYGLLDAILSGGTTADVLLHVARQFDYITEDGLQTCAFGIIGPLGDRPTRVVHDRPECPFALGAAVDLAAVDPESWIGHQDDDLTEIPLSELPGDVATMAAAEGFEAAQVGSIWQEGRCAAAVMWLVNNQVVGGIRGNAHVVRAAVLRAVSLAVRRDRADAVLRHAAFHDPLTGLSNRAGLDRAVAALVDSGPIAVLYVDVDDFKDVNDAHGHRVGDLVLGEIADRLAAACRPSDLVARVGGDEFTVLLAGVDAAVAANIGQRVVEQVRRPMTVTGGPAAVTVTVGVAGPGSPQAMADLVDAADRALLLGKRQRQVEPGGRLVIADRAVTD